MGKLTAKTVESLARGKVPGLTGDGDGLYFQISKTGGVSWIYRYKTAGRLRNMGLGGYPMVSLAEARDKAAEVRRQWKSGVDPLEARDAERERQQQAAEQERFRLAQEQARSVPFRTLAAEYIASHRAGWKNTKHAQQWENTLATYAFPVIGQLPAHEVTIEHVLAILTPIWHAKTETASRVRNRIELVLDAAKARGLRDGENPARWRGHLDKLLPKRTKVCKVEHHQAMPWSDLPQFMVELAGRPELSYQAIKLTILTACRTSEVLGARWSEIDREARTWIIPTERMKAGREHRVPLSAAALALLDELPRLGDSPFLFPGQRAGKPLSNMAMLMGLRRMGRGNLTMHGFRSTFRDWAAECTHHPREVCELALAHQVSDGAEAAYWRSDIFAKRRALMDDWSAYACP